MMNPYEFFQTRMVAMITHGFAFDAVHASLDLKGASEVWGGPELDAHAAWYFWLDTAPGAYQLRLSHADVVDFAETPATRGVFTVKYYPSRHEPLFRHFSAQERALVEGEDFDDTNTPDMDALALIPENLFAVGTIEITCDRDNEESFLRFTSLDIMRFEEAAGHAANGAGGPEPAANGAGRLRQVPTWNIGYPLFDALTGLHAFLARTAPRRIVLSEQPGFEFVSTVDGGMEDRDCDGVKLRSMLIGFGSDKSATRSPFEEAIAARQCADPWTALIDTATSGAGDLRPHRALVHGPNCTLGAPDGHEAHDGGAGHGHGHIKTRQRFRIGESLPDASLDLNKYWWTLAENEQTANTLPCGCSSH